MKRALAKRKGQHDVERRTGIEQSALAKKRGMAKAGGRVRERGKSATDRRPPVFTFGIPRMLFCADARPGSRSPAHARPIPLIAALAAR
jgi:hypothetical protein